MSDMRDGGNPADVGRWNKRPIHVQGEPSVPAFVDEISRRVLTEWGFRLDEKAPTALRIEIAEFRVDVLELIVGHVTLRAVLAASDGTVIWERSVTGDAHRFGLSHNADNYNEALSDALKGALASLVTAPEFQDAVTERSKGDGALPSVPTPAALLASLREMQGAGVSPDLLLGFVKQFEHIESFAAHDVVAWKDAGIPDVVMAEALQRSKKAP
ncbi:MAG TPA: YajG family lipoprotein [Candidatus Polarisedimenticolaceae bacterium]|nr:YajG family lipoprotein [Candidatus Polarisedimenticolaceae bacterium]